MYTTLNLFKDDAFFSQLDPIYITINKKIILKNLKGDFVEQDGFILRRRHLLKLIEENDKKLALGEEYEFSFLNEKLKFKDLNFSMEQDKQIIFKSISDSVNTIFYCIKDSSKKIAISQPSTISKFLLPISLTALTKGMDPNIFIENSHLHQINGLTINNFALDAEFIKQMNFNYPGQHFNFLNKILNTYVDYHGLSLYQSENQEKQFSQEWSEAERKKHDLHILNFLDNKNLLLTDEEKIIIKSNAIKTFQVDKNKEIPDASIISYLVTRPQETETICESLKDVKINTIPLGKSIKKMVNELKTLQDENYIDESIVLKSITTRISWQKISIQKFSQVNSRVDIPNNFWDNQILKRDQVNQVYQNSEVPVLMQIFSYLEIAEKILNHQFNSNVKNELKIKIEDDQGNKLEQSDNIYLTREGLFFKIQMANHHNEDDIQEIIKKVIHNISMNTLSSADYAISSIQKILIEHQIHKQPNSDNALNDEIKNTPYKL